MNINNCTVSQLSVCSYRWKQYIKIGAMPLREMGDLLCISSFFVLIPSGTLIPKISVYTVESTRHCVYVSPASAGQSDF